MIGWFLYGLLAIPVAIFGLWLSGLLVVTVEYENR